MLEPQLLSEIRCEDGLLATPKALRTLPVSESFTSDMEAGVVRVDLAISHVEVDAYGNEEVMELAEEVG